MANTDAPTSYKDPTYASLDEQTTDKLGLPKGLLSAIRERGERSNADQVSSAGARTVYQITPATRKLALDKWGVDPYLSPENASEVAGLLLKDSLDRNAGHVPTAVAEYVGGTNRDNWGPVTHSYVKRVTGSPLDAAPTKGSSSAPRAVNPLSLADRMQADQQSREQGSIANVYKAYSSGQMTPEDAKAFEDEVSSGRILLPRGAQLNASAAPAPAAADPGMDAVIAAYKAGKMSPEDAQAFEGLVKSGEVQVPGALSDSALIPGQAPDVQAPPADHPVAAAGPEPGLLDKAIGAGEAGLQVATGATGGALGLIGGTLKGLAEQILSGQFGTQQAASLVEKSAAEGANALTYQPRTPAGQEMSQQVGDVMQNLIPLAGIAGTMPHLSGAKGAPASVVARAGAEGIVRDVAGDAAAGVAAKAGDAAARVIEAGAKGATTLPRRALAALQRDETATPTPGTLGSAGSAATDMATQRQQLASDLPVPISLTKGQASRDPAQLKFEVETAKLPEAGKPIRDRLVQQNEQILRNIDWWIDQTGAEAPNLRAVGESVDSALVQQSRADKAKIRAAYQEAERAGEMAAPVSLNRVVDYLNQAEPESATAPLLNTVRRVAIKLGIAREENGMLVPAEAAPAKPIQMPQGWGGLYKPEPMQAAPQGVTLGKAELFRQAINRNTDLEPTNVRQATILKGLIDEATAGSGGELYRQARALRQRYAQNYEDRASIAKLLSTKRGMADRQVALEDVFDHSILRASLDDVRNTRRVLQRSGMQGQQAWRDLQGATATWIRDQATRTSATDSMGNRVVSVAGLDKAIQTLDADGRLDFIFGKQGAQRMRDIRDLAQIARTVPPEAAVNTSNTATALLAGFADIGTSSLSGVPLPIATMVRVVRQYVKDAALRRRIEDALGELQRKQAPNQSNPPLQAPAPTLH